MSTRRLAAAALAVLLLPGCALQQDLLGAAGSPTSTPAAAAPVAAAAAAPPAPSAPVGTTLLATLRADTAVATSPGGTDQQVLPARTAFGAPTTVPVIEDRGDWLRVLLPGRPNGRSGWLRAAEVDLTATDWRLEVSLSAHRLRVYRGLMLVAEHPVGVGKAVTPTPRGTWFVTDLLRPSDPEGPYGPYAFGLSSRSEVLTSFAGGDGQIGLHGTDDEAGIGQDVSSGCLRVHDEVVRELAGKLPLGTPVEVTA